MKAQNAHADNGDCTYANPLISVDFPNPDVIRVDDVYYLVTTTIFVFPGVTILKSHYLVNWEYCRNAIPQFILANATIWIAVTVMYTDNGNQNEISQWKFSAAVHNKVGTSKKIGAIVRRIDI